MKLSAIALKNLKRNFSFYSLYLFSVSFVLMIYFCFTSFSMNQIIMEKISSDGRVETMCRTVAVFIMAFVVFYMFYSNSFFMRRRMRELGIYSLLGYRKSTILKLLIFENVMICFGGMMLGILTGSILHKIVIADPFGNIRRSKRNPSNLPGSSKGNPFLCNRRADYTYTF